MQQSQIVPSNPNAAILLSYFGVSSWQNTSAVGHLDLENDKLRKIGWHILKNSERDAHEVIISGQVLKVLLPDTAR